MFLDHYIRSVELLKDTIPDNKVYPFSLPAVKYLDTIDFDEHITFLVWENGTWKSTLLEAIAIHYGFNPEWWSKNFNFATEHSHSVLEQNIRVVKWITRPKDWYFLRAESFYNVASNIDALDKWGWWAPIKHSYGWKSLHEQSHWEAFFSLFMHRFGGDGIYLLDEPEAALSPQRQLAFLIRLNELIQQKSQFIIATHSPILLAYPNAKIITISEKGYKEVKYEDTDHYQVYKSFLQDHQGMIKKLGIN